MLRSRSAGNVGSPIASGSLGVKGGIQVTAVSAQALVASTSVSTWCPRPEVCSFLVSVVTSNADAPFLASPGGGGCSSSSSAPVRVVCLEDRLELPAAALHGLSDAALRAALLPPPGRAAMGEGGAAGAELEFRRIAHVELDGKRRILRLRLRGGTSGALSLSLVLHAPADLAALRLSAWPLLTRAVMQNTAPAVAWSPKATGIGGSRTLATGPSLVWTHA